ncbi:TatD family hydrolase [Candidatus Woesearchaeota archaeon]|nr:TatD family hydrolase [Candidatus Woesearchaeota archaeon]
MVMLVDVHAHMDYPQLLADVAEIVDRAKAAGVKAIIANGVDAVSNRKVLELASKYDVIKPALGIYPPDALKEEQGELYCPLDVDAEIGFIRSQDPFAIGEVGLDLKNGKDFDMQKELFQKMIEIAKEKDVPVIVHTRKAEEQAIDILEGSGYGKVILHCFSGRKSLIKRAADLGFYFSIPTNVVKSEHFQNLVKMVHISKLLTETDAPFLPPFPSKINEPAYVIESVKKIAEIKGMTVDDTANNIFKNYQDLFLK